VDFYTTAGNPVRQASEAVIAGDWAKVGVKVNPNYVTVPKLFDASWSGDGVLQHGLFQVCLHGFTSSPEPDTNRTLFQSRFIDRRQQQHSPLNQNTSAVSDPVLDKEFDIAKGTFSSSVRRKAYYTIQEELDKKAHWIMLYFKPVTITWNPKVQNVVNNPTNCQVTCNAYKWAVKS
jgi:ABC-type transport system substrate-binding protein